MLKIFRKSRSILHIFICAIALVMFVGCTENRISSDVRINLKKTKEKIKSEVIELPDVATSERVLEYFTVTTENLPVMISMLKNEQGTKLEYYISRLQEDGTWETEVPKWNDNCVNIKGYNIISVSEDQNGCMYALMFGRELTKQKVVRLNKDGSIRELNLSNVRKQYKGMVLSAIALIDSEKMVLQFVNYNPDESISNDDSEEKNKNLVQAVQYDIVNETPLEIKGVMYSENYNFDLEGVYYTSNVEQGLIVGRKIDSKLNEYAIKCGDSVPLAADINLKDDSGYVVTSDGLYGGKLVSGQWECLISSQDMQITQNTKNFSLLDVPFIPDMGQDVSKLVKGVNSENEIYCLVECSQNGKLQSVWIHYYE